MYDVWSLSVKPSTHHLTNNVSSPPGTGLDGTRLPNLASDQLRRGLSVSVSVSLVSHWFILSQE